MRRSQDPVTPPRASRYLRAGFVGLRFSLLVAVAACNQDAPTGPGEGAPSLARRKSSQKTAEESLKQLEEREKARIALAQVQSQATYDALKVEWQRFLDSGASQADSPLLICDPLQYTAQIKIVGPEGADLDVGPHKLSIPAGALTTSTVITAEALTSLNVEVKFSPHGISFAKRPTLVLSYKHCYTRANADAPYDVVYLGKNKQIVEWWATTDSKDYGLVSAAIGHFSTYAVAY
ncbi:MAG: hypothetical protein ACKVZ0_24795 [Gemmatimonadales bacterium]